MPFARAWAVALLAALTLLAACDGWDDDARFVPATSFVCWADAAGVRLLKLNGTADPLALHEGSVQALELAGSQLFALTDSGRVLRRWNAETGADNEAYALAEQGALLCAGEKTLLVLDAESQQAVLRELKRPDRRLAALPLSGGPTAAYWLGGKFYIATTDARLLVLDETAKAWRTEIKLAAPALEMGHDANNRLHCRLLHRQGAFHEQTVDVNGDVVVAEQTLEPLRRRAHSPYSRSLYEKERLQAVDQRRDSTVAGLSSPADTFFVDFFESQLWTVRGDSLRAFDLRKQTAAPLVYALVSPPLKGLRFCLRVPNR